MAKELAHFKNFAKLKDTEVAFNDITVIAGKPGTGKSYVMKMMYAIDETYYLLKSEIKEFTKETKNVLSDLNVYIKKLKETLVDSDELNEKNITLELDKYINKLQDVTKYRTYGQNDKDSELIITEEMNSKLQNLLNSIFTNIEQVSDKFSLTFEHYNLTYHNKKVNIKFTIDRKEELKDSASEMQEVIFVETPLILEFKKFMKREEGKTPYHIESLLNILDTDYSFTDEEQDKFIKDFTKKSKEIIKGDIESSGDSFIFNKEGDKNYDIVNASSGTKSIGLLQYLVTNKALKKGSVLYWEEPEVHLHPEWQLKMVDLFVELMNAGVKIVFSTHSPFMADYLNALSKRNDFADRISFNVFKENDGVVENHILDENNWNILQDELMDSFEDILWTYL